MRLSDGCSPFRGPEEIPFGLEEVAARMLFEAKRLKFLMSERE
jgi:hypothetical protein